MEDAAAPTVEDASAPSKAPAAPRGPPAALPLIIAVILPLAYSLFCAPLFKSASNPDSNVGRLPVFVSDLDGGLLGQSFIAFANTAMISGASVVTVQGGLPVTLPGFQLVTGYTPDSLRAAVRNAEVYAAVFVNAGASSRLSDAMATPAGALAYKPQEAITFVWDEARNNFVTTARVAGPIKGLMTAFAQSLSASLLSAGYPSTANFSSSADKAALARVLAVPASITEESLFPYTIPAFNTALLVGQILLCVFSLVITNVIMGPLSKHPLISHGVPGINLALRRLVVVLLLSCTVAAAFATIVAGLSQTDNLMQLPATMARGITGGATGTGALSGTQWAAIWAW